MVNPTLTYDNEYNRRLQEILTNYDIEASRNSPTMVTGGMRLKSHVDAGNTPYDGREGTAPFSVSKHGGRLPHEMRNPPITDMRYRGRDNMPSKEELISAYNAVKSGGEMIGGNDAKFWGKFALDTGVKAYLLRNQVKNLTGYGNRRANRKEDAVYWRDFADDTAKSMLNLGDTSKKLFGGRGKRANRKEDATYWRDFADGTAKSMLNLGDTTKKLFGGRGRGKRANRKEDAVFWRDFADGTAKSMLNLGDTTKKLFGGNASDVVRYMPKVMMYNAINNATGRKLPPLFGGEGVPKIKRAVSARGAIVSKVMKEQGLSLPMASKYVKEHNLY